MKFMVGDTTHAPHGVEGVITFFCWQRCYGLNGGNSNSGSGTTNWGKATDFKMVAIGVFEVNRFSLT